MKKAGGKAAILIAMAAFIFFNTFDNPECSEPLQVMTKVYGTKTSDGWTLSVNRYALKDSPVKKKGAVILCHGFNINNSFWDLSKKCSLARYLASDGYDVWVPSLRGSGLSSKPILADMRGMLKLDIVNVPQVLMKAPLDLTKFDWTIDDHIHQDVPAIIDLVIKESGFDKVYWIGHSMGGIIMFGYLEVENHDRDKIAGFVPIGSMMIITQPLSTGLKMIANQKPLLTASLLINTTAASQFRNITLGTVKSPIEELLMDSKNMETDVMYKFFHTAIDDTSPGVVAQFSDSIKTGKMVSSDNNYNYTANLRLVNTPVLILGGNKDGFISEEGLQKTYAMVGSEDKKVVIFSKADGYSADYGHCDLILGKDSEKEVYPVILNWLNDRVNKKLALSTPEGAIDNTAGAAKAAK